MIEFISGPAGKIQLPVEKPDYQAVGISITSHPQLLLGGSPHHIGPHSIARRLVAESWITVRPSFRGVDGTDGSDSVGVGEVEDAVAVVD